MAILRNIQEISEDKNKDDAIGQIAASMHGLTVTDVAGRENARIKGPKLAP